MATNVPEWAPRFLKEFRRLARAGNLNVRLAADFTVISESFVHRYRKNPNATAFRKAWDEIVLEARMLELARRERTLKIRRALAEEEGWM